MATPKKPFDSLEPAFLEEEVSARKLDGIDGLGRWLVFAFAPTALFSLKASQATSTVGRTLLVPTPYSVKMALLDAGLRTGLVAAAEDADWLVRSLARAELRLGVPQRAVVTHTIVKVRQEPKIAQPGAAYIANVAYREFVHFQGDLRIAIELTTISSRLANLIGRLMAFIVYFGKRGSFVQYLGAERLEALPANFTRPLEQLEAIPRGIHFSTLDDFGPEANFDALNSFSKTPIKREKHRKFVEMAVPLGLVRSGPGFTEYRCFLTTE